MSTLKQEIVAAENRHRMRMLGLSDERWASDRHGLIEGSRHLMEREIAALRRRAANENLSRCTGSVTAFNPLAGMEKKNVR